MGWCKIITNRQRRSGATTAFGTQFAFDIAHPMYRRKHFGLATIRAAQSGFKWLQIRGVGNIFLAEGVDECWWLQRLYLSNLPSSLEIFEKRSNSCQGSPCHGQSYECGGGRRALAHHKSEVAFRQGVPSYCAEAKDAKEGC